MRDAARNRIRRACGIGSLIAEKRAEVTRRRQPDAEYERIFDRVLERVEQCRVEPVLDADLSRVRLPRERCRRTVRECPVAAGDRDGAFLFACWRFATRRYQPCLRRIQRYRWIWRRLSAWNHQRGGVAGQLCEAHHQRPGDARAVGIFRDRYLNRVIGRGWNDITLPAADEGDVTIWMRHGIAATSVDHGVD